MKITEIIDFKVRDLLGAGVTPRYLTITARALEMLCKELHAEQGENAALALTMAQPCVTYKELEIVVAEISRLDPICVSGIVRDEMDIYSMKVKK